MAEDERLNRVLRRLSPTERATVFTYAERGGITWAAAAAGAADPDAFGERVRRKVKRLAAEQARRTAMVRAVQDSDQHFAPDVIAP